VSGSGEEGPQLPEEPVSPEEQAKEGTQESFLSAKLRADVARQQMRLAKDQLKRARKRFKEARREAKRARKLAVVARRAWKRTKRREGSPPRGKPQGAKRAAPKVARTSAARRPPGRRNVRRNVRGAQSKRTSRASAARRRR